MHGEQELRMSARIPAMNACERVALPPDAVLTVELAEVSRGGSPAAVVARREIEPAGQPTEPVVQAAARNSQVQQAAVAATPGRDRFNLGYYPYHFGAVEGSYSTRPDGVARIVEFRDMVSSLNRNGLRVVMDVVYNHTAASGQDDHSVLDKIVPGYYYRYTTDGSLYTDSCCSDTASEYEMVEKLMIDTLTRWAVDYKVDGFRFDLMNFHTPVSYTHLTLPTIHSV